MLLMTDFCIWVGQGIFPREFTRHENPKEHGIVFNLVPTKSLYTEERKGGRKMPLCSNMLGRISFCYHKASPESFGVFDGHGICPLQMVECCIKPKMSYESKKVDCCKETKELL
jgi:hypothetical protein